MERRRGSALMLTLLVMTLVAVLAANLAWITGVDARLTRNQLTDTRQFGAALGGIELAKTFLMADHNEGQEADGHSEIWADPGETDQAIGESEVQISLIIESEEGKINLNGLLREDLRPLTESLIKTAVVAIGYGEELGDAVLERVDAVVGDGDQPLGTLYDLVTEDITLAMIEGDSLVLIEEGLLPEAPEVIGLAEIFTVMSTGDLNVNLMKKPVFQAAMAVLPDSLKTETDNAALAENYAEHVGQPGDDVELMTEIKQLSDVSGLAKAKIEPWLAAQEAAASPEDLPKVLRGLLKTRSETFRAEIRIDLEDLQKRYDAYLRRSLDDGRCRLLFYKDMDLSARPASDED